MLIEDLVIIVIIGKMTILRKYSLFFQNVANFSNCKGTKIQTIKSNDYKDPIMIELQIEKVTNIHLMSELLLPDEINAILVDLSHFVLC